MSFKKFFNEVSDVEFTRITSSDENCLAFLADLKWKTGYKCRKCGNANYCKGRSPHSRRCTRCKMHESAMAHTPFHGCRLPLPLAFKIVRQICCMPKVSTWELSRQTKIRQMTCWKLKNKISRLHNISEIQ